MTTPDYSALRALALAVRRNANSGHDLFRSRALELAETVLSVEAVENADRGEIERLTAQATRLEDERHQAVVGAIDRETALEVQAVAYRAEIHSLRDAVIDIASMSNARRDTGRQIWAYRTVANITSEPFSLARVEEKLGEFRADDAIERESALETAANRSRADLLDAQTEIDKLREAVRVAESIRDEAREESAAKIANARTYMRERDAYRAMVCDLLASAHPHPTEHPTMTRQWARARALLKDGPVPIEARRFAASPSGRCGNCDRELRAHFSGPAYPILGAVYCDWATLEPTAEQRRQEAAVYLEEGLKAQKDALAARDARQSAIFAWASAAFTVAQATSIPQRGLRLLEEATECAQACGLGEDAARNLVAFVYARPVGEIGQEIGGVSVCVLALAAAAGLSAEAEEKREVERVLSKPIEEFTKRNAAKNAAGLIAMKDEG